MPGPSSSALPGSGRLKGSRALLYLDWFLLRNRPDLDLYEQGNKAGDILMALDVILLDPSTLLKGKKEETDVRRKEIEGDLDKLWSELNDLMKDHYRFDELDGMQEWKNTYWRNLRHLLSGLYRLTYREGLIESADSEEWEVPEQ